MAPVWVDRERLISVGLFSKGRLGEFDAGGRFLRTVGELPENPRRVPPPVLQHAYTGTLVARPDRSRFALLTRHADRIELYGPDGSTVRIVEGADRFQPVYTVAWFDGIPSMASGDDMPFVYIDAATTDRHIFALYSGRTRGEGAAHFGAFIRVFDWDGTLRRVFKLDQWTLAIAVSPDGRTLYGVRHDPAPAVVRWRLPAVT
jgi:hypothetical protein